ncbi:MAG: carbohydrate ABC transporter permease [Clostridia bacterium]|nr:carbohydrate ABC transporter permease [Clostridia bacterium]
MITKNLAFKIVMYALLAFLVLACVMPFWMLFVSSLTSETALAKSGYNFVFTEFSTAAYEYLWGVRGSILRAYGMSVLITAVGVSVNVVLTVLFAYPLSRQDLPGRRVISFFLFFTMLFNGGFVPTYMVYTQVFHLKDSLAGLIIPYLLMNAFHIMMMRTYITTNVPKEVNEAAKIDGATEVQCLTRIVLPMSKPIIATIALMALIAYWNNWTNGIYFITTRTDLYGIQNYLTSVMNNATFLQTHSMGSGVNFKIPNVSVRMAIAIIAVIPVLLMYPFFQKSFVKGITLGSVKG